MPGPAKSVVLALLVLVCMPVAFDMGALGQTGGKMAKKLAGLGKEFVSKTARVNGIKLHYVRGGSGPTVVLIHGFPQDWYEYHAIMPRLAKQFTLIAVDLRGVGESTASKTGYDAANMAEDIHQLLNALKLGQAYVVGHDIGGMVAYAFVRQFPELTRGVMILDVPLPGIAGWKEVQSDPSVWHVRFMQVPGLPEKLVYGRQADYFEYFFHFGRFTEREKKHFVEAYSTKAQLRAAFGMYRAFPDNEKFNAAQTGRVDVPVFFGAGEQSPFSKMVSTFAEGLRANGCTNVETGLVRGAVHYLLEDQPDEVAALIEQHAVAEKRQ